MLLQKLSERIFVAAPWIERIVCSDRCTLKNRTSLWNTPCGVLSQDGLALHYVKQRVPMGIEIILGLMVLCIGAGGAYVLMEYRAFGERESAQKKLNGVQSTLNAVKKELSGYTKYADFLVSAKPIMLDKKKSMHAKVNRELSHVENIPKDPPRIKNIVTIVVKYNAEFVFEVDLKPESFDIVLTNNGIQIQVNKPSLVGLPVVKITSNEIPLIDTLEDEKPYIHEIQKKLPPIAYAYGPLLAMEECVRAFSEKKLIECLREYLMAQAGVKKVPVISVAFK